MLFAGYQTFINCWAVFVVHSNNWFAGPELYGQRHLNTKHVPGLGDNIKFASAYQAQMEN